VQQIYFDWGRRWRLYDVVMGSRLRVDSWCWYKIVWDQFNNRWWV